MSLPAPLAALSDRLGHAFRAPALLVEALTHPSYVQDHPEAAPHNQRLEFLGDAVLQIVIADALFRLFPDVREGLLTRRRAILVNRHMLATLARELGAETALRFGKSEARGAELPSALSDAFEALVGAVYLDSDFPTVRAVVLRVYGDLEARLSANEGHDNPKGRLQEIVQPKHGNEALRYELLATNGEDHAREYEVAVLLLDREIGRGKGSSKKTAEEEAARAALGALPAE